MAKYANVIVDISIEKLDKTFQYRIPDELETQIREGVQVDIPFGNRTLTGYVIEITDIPEYDIEKIRPLCGVHPQSVAIESRLIELAAWIRKNYGGTMNQALKTVIPVRHQTKEIVKKTIVLAMQREDALRKLALLENRHASARAGLLRMLLAQNSVDYSYAVQELKLSAAAIRAMMQQGILQVISETGYRNPLPDARMETAVHKLNDEQMQTVDHIRADWEAGKRKTYLLKGVTGSGKTEVYMELIAGVVASGRQAIMLIPEIALTLQTVLRFRARFGDRVSIINSRLSQGERYDQFRRAREGKTDIMIGPRSAVFTPFPNLGLIIIDEEHEPSYKSETVPRYHAREVAIYRAASCGASVVLGSATPSVYSRYQAENGTYELLELKHRVNERPMPDCEIVDLRQELRSGNRSILSLRLQELMEKKLELGEQTMLFINRRGISGFMSCRACGYVVKCPHCDVSLSQHSNGKMICHYCGYEEAVPKVCPSCGSKYISGFKAGTQKIEQMVKTRFPQARVLRMDYDTTRRKDSYEEILQAFADQKADILIGTQMIVKGHDFPNVTLVGVLAADMSLHVSDFHAAERTFQLLTQSAGRAGRGEKPGNVVIQCYSPEHFAVQTACAQDYDAFYRQEIAYRRLLYYPPVWNLLVIFCTSPDQEELGKAVDAIYRKLSVLIAHREEKIRSSLGLSGLKVPIPAEKRLLMIGPADASVARVNDIYRKVIYLKTSDYRLLTACKDRVESFTADQPLFKEITIQFDFNPASGF